MEDEHERLAQMLIDVAYNDSLPREVLDKALGRDSSMKTQPPKQDSFVKAMRAMKHDHEFIVWIVFACRLLLDTQTIMGDKVGKSLQELRSQAYDQWDTMDYMVNASGALDFGGAGERWLDKDGFIPLYILSLIHI